MNQYQAGTARVAALETASPHAAKFATLAALDPYDVMTFYAVTSEVMTS